MIIEYIYHNYEYFNTDVFEMEKQSTKKKHVAGKWLKRKVNAQQFTEVHTVAFVNVMSLGAIYDSSSQVTYVS
jgi:hypothetical protein